ncbi:MAG: AAA family ATPase [Actinobacteria bacterium]|nr:AAA family ATPase [Actinomycetota bacterium]
MNSVVTILFTDLVGSTELFRRIGEDRADALRREHFAMLRAALATHGGEEVKSIGDSIMAAFVSPARGIACAIEMQQRVDALGRGGGHGLALRVGMNAGEATVEDGDYFGIPVVIAKRLCDDAEPGEILVSDVVRALVGSRGSFTFKSVGSLALKGIDDPVPACAVSWEPFSQGVPLPVPIVTDQTLLVGREKERGTLRKAFMRAREGNRSLVLIAGEPGIGKTSLAYDFAREAHSKGATVLYGRCGEDLMVPFQPFAEALEHLIRHVPEVLRDGGDELSRLVPGLAPTREGLQGDAEADRYRLFETIRETLASPQDASPLVLVLDDLHWADKPTLMLLRHLARAPEGPFLLGTYRDVELDRRHPFAETLADLRREEVVERVVLRGLTEDGVLDYMERRAGQTLDKSGRDLASALHRETEGNPFFVREIMRHLVEAGAILEQDGRWSSTRPIEEVGLPESVREVIGRRLNRLSEGCGEVLSVGSVIGRDFDLAVLARVSGINEDALADLLDEAVRAGGVIEEVSNVMGLYSFSHALVRETLYEELSTNRRVRLHRRVGEALEDLFASDPGPYLSELAHHFFEASIGGAEDKAIDYAVRAGSRAIDQFAYEEAIAHFERALQLLESLPQPDSLILCETLIACAEGHLFTANLSAGRQYALSAAEIARREVWPERLARAALAYGGLWIDIGVVQEELVALLREGIAGLSEEHPLVPLLEGRLAMDLFSGDPAELEAHSLRAVELARKGADPRTLAYALVARRHAISGPARLNERDLITSEAVTLAREVGDNYLEMRARTFKIVELVESADLEAADRDFDEFFRLSEEYRQPFYQQYLSRFFRVGIALREGRFEEADEILTPLMELARLQGRVTATMATAGQRIQLEMARGQVERIDQVSIDISLGFMASVPWWASVRSFTLWNLNRLEEARTTWAEGALEAIRSLGDHWGTLMAIAAASEMAEVLGDKEAASEVYERAQPFAGRIVPVAGTALVYVADTVDDVLGKCAELLGRFDAAIHHYESAADLLLRWRMRPFHVINRMRLARTLLQRGSPADLDRARELLDHSLNEASEMGLGAPIVAQSQVLRETL